MMMPRQQRLRDAPRKSRVYRKYASPRFSLDGLFEAIPAILFKAFHSKAKFSFIYAISDDYAA